MMDDKYRDVEIIDFIEPEIIDFTTGEDEIEIPAIKDDVIVIDDNEEEKVENKEMDVVKEEEIDVPSASPITAAPLEATGVLRKIEIPKEDEKVDVPKMPENPVKIEEHSVVSESTPYIIASPDKKTKEEVEEEIISPKEEKSNDTKKVEGGSSNRFVGILILIILLVASIGLNVFLLVSESSKVVNNPDENTNEVSSTKETLYLNQFKIEVPSNWSTVTEKDSGHLVFMDNSEEWAVSINVRENLAASQIIDNVDKITENFGKAKYNFSSDYKADSLGDDFYVFKGKYFNYTTYVVTKNLNSSTVAIADLKFKGEVNDEIYDAVIDVLNSIVRSDIESSFSDNFEFNDVSSILADIIKVTDDDNK